MWSAIKRGASHLAVTSSFEDRLCLSFPRYSAGTRQRLNEIFFRSLREKKF